MPEPDINAVIHDINKHVVEPTELTNPGFSEQVRLRWRRERERERKRERVYEKGKRCV